MFDVKQPLSELFNNILTPNWYTDDSHTDTEQYDIIVGDHVYFYDDDDNQWRWGIYEGFYADLNAAGECSPLLPDLYSGQHRMVITDMVSDGNKGKVRRTNYILPENIYSADEWWQMIYEETE